MECRQCSSQNRQSFYGEFAIHFPGISGLTKSHRMGFSHASLFVWYAALPNLQFRKESREC